MTIETQANSLMPVLLETLPYAVGLLAFVGGFVSSIILERIKEKSMLKKLKREKLEQLVIAAHESRAWLEKKLDIELLDKNIILEKEPIHEIFAISVLHFPELKVESSKFISTYIKFQKSISDCKLEKTEAKNISEKNLQKAYFLYENLVDSILELTNKAAEIMEDLNKS